MHRVLRLLVTTTCAAALCTIVAPSVARAQTPTWSGDAKKTATAQALFDAARAEMDAGRFTEACPKLEEVLRLEPSGAGAKLKLAECYEGAGKLASAFAMYAVAETSARTAGQEERALWAHDRASALKPRLSTVTIVVPEPTAGLAGLVVTRDGVDVGRAQWGAPIPVDGGVVRVAVDAPGHLGTTRTTDVRPEGDALTITLDPLDLAPATAPIPAPPPPVAEAPPSAPTLAAKPPRATDATGGTVPTWAWVTGSLGLASGIAGIALRIDGARVEADQADACGAARDRCPADYDVEGTNQRKLIDYGLFVGLGSAGAVALGVAAIGAIVGVTDPGRPAAVALTLAPSESGCVLGVRGAFE